MREKTIVPTTLMEWPKVAKLLPEQKLVTYFLWAGRYTNTLGIIASPPIEAMAASLGLQAAALETGLGNLESAGIILFDREAGELVVCDWHRFHTFAGVGRQIAAREAAKVTSSKIKNHLSKVAPWLFEASYPHVEQKQEVKPPTPNTQHSTQNNNNTSTGATAPVLEGVVVVFADGSFTNCPVQVADPDALKNYVNQKYAAGLLKGDCAGYAASMLARSGGKPLSLPSVSKVGTPTPPEKTAVEGRLAELVGKKFMSARGNLVEVAMLGGALFLLLPNKSSLPLAGEEGVKFLARIDAGDVLDLGDDLKAA